MIKFSYLLCIFKNKNAVINENYYFLDAQCILDGLFEVQLYHWLYHYDFVLFRGVLYMKLKCSRKLVYFTLS